MPLPHPDELDCPTTETLEAAYRRAWGELTTLIRQTVEKNNQLHDLAEQIAANRAVRPKMT